MRPIPDNHTFYLRLRVTNEMTARFFDCEIHPVYATFAIVEHAEYASRCVIMPFLEPHEDAVGYAINIEHTGPAIVGDIVTITATVRNVDGRSIDCAFTVARNEEPIATGNTVQRLVDKNRMKGRIESLYAEQSGSV